MPRFNSTDELLDYAIAREAEAFAFYASLAEIVESANLREMFSDFAHEELGHKAKLTIMKKEGRFFRSGRRITELNIAENLAPVKPVPEMGYAEALRLAMQREKDAYRLYTNLAGMVQEDDIRATLLLLAREEANHKLRFEIEYEDFVTSEN